MILHRNLRAACRVVERVYLGERAALVAGDALSSKRRATASPALSSRNSSEATTWLSLSLLSWGIFKFKLYRQRAEELLAEREAYLLIEHFQGSAAGNLVVMGELREASAAFG